MKVFGGGESLLSFAVLCFACQVGAPLCGSRSRSRCRCPAVSRCPPAGLPVPERCGLCAKQRGEHCTSLEVCDPNAELFCDYSAGDSETRGICTPLETGTCEMNGVTYKDGDVFQPNCKYHCWCSDGGIGCIPRCSEDIRLPSADCPYPKRVQIPGKCCPEWICERLGNSIVGNALAAFRSAAFYGRVPSTLTYDCIEQSSTWSSCSRSCGLGVSTRVSNKNNRCVLETQSQLCIERPCHQEHFEQTSMGRKVCEPTTKARKPIHFEYKDCVSAKTFTPTYCGSCSDSRCCTPHRTRTELLEFKCKRGRVVKQRMMFIITCACHHNCPSVSKEVYAV
ncbi:CCN family member 2 [Callorhinchus milii]|nr:CCN family member 2 [Callorhinchus milii]